MSQPRARSRGERVRALGFSWLVGLTIGSLVGLSWLSAAPLLGVQAWIFAHAALVCSVAILALVPALALLPLFLRARALRGEAWVQALVWSLFALALYADTRVFALFRYHFNGMVWNLFTTGGAGDAVQIPASNWILAGLGALLLALALGWLFRRSAGWWAPLSRASRAVTLGAWTLAALLLLEKGLFARADLVRDRNVTALARCFPLYQRLTVERLAARVFGMKLEARPGVALAGEGLLLRYPLERLVPAASAPRPNVLIVVIDSLRADALTNEIMPNLSRYAQTARVFRDHVSGGNATRFGIFSLLYGLHGAYWKPVLEENAPTQLVRTLQDLSYDVHAFSGPSLSSPEFRSTVFVSMEAQVEDELPGTEKHARDTLLAERFRHWNAARRLLGGERPFFAFVLLDSPHQAYSYPPGAEVFRPSAGEVDYVAMSSSPAPEQVQAVRNRFQNAVHHADHVLGELLDELSARGELEHTLVCVTGDHGEEFLEHGRFGHTSDFTPEQVHVAFVLGGPGIPPGEETRPTAHVDLVPTLLEAVGVPASSRGSYSNGESLLAPPAQRVRVIAGWEELGLWLPGGILRVPLEGSRGGIEPLAYDWTPHPDGDAFVRANTPALAALAEACRRFLR